MRERLLQRLYRLMDSPLGAVLGGLCYGLWALFVNRHAGWPHAALIGATHWAMSALLTYGSVALMRTLFWLPRDPRHGAMLSAAGSLALTYTMLIGVHHAIGTPQILMTLAPGLLPTFSFAIVYSSLLLRETADPTWTLSLARRKPVLVSVPGGHDARA
ncbi:MAG: hypothetical protein NVS9B10_07310 [Nevskia sp.]